MAIATINRLIGLFQRSFETLKAPASMAQIERLAMVVHQCMGAKTRAYHNNDHVLGLCEGANPVQTLAALFHDTVYFQLDAGLPAALTTVLADVVTVHGGEVLLAHPGSPAAADPTIESAEHLLPVVVDVFGFRFGQALPPFGGMNEFLSAVTAVRLLAPYIPLPTLVHVAACIEATIAFRPDAANGQSALDHLHNRLQQVFQKTPFAQTADEARRTATAIVTDATALANRDVAGFAVADPSVFLSQTWLLIEESNKPLSSVGLYTIQEYRLALQRMDGFLANLNPAAVFQAFHGEPATDAMAELSQKAQGNIGFSVRYLRAKLLAMAVLEAFAHFSGGDAPISMFMGDVADAPASRSDASYDSTTLEWASTVDPELFRVLHEGRARESTNDLSASPTAALIYRSLGEEGLAYQWQNASRFFAGALAPLEYLQQWPSHITLPLLDTCIATAISRQDSLSDLRTRLAGAASP